MRGDKTKRLALYGMMVALAFLFGYVESLIPVMFFVPGIKLGLANLVTMVSLYLLGVPAALSIAVVRVILTGFTFGNLSMMMYAMAGTAVSLFLMIISKKMRLFSEIGVSILGGIGHNIGQLLMASYVLQTTAVFAYFPVLLIAGLVAGACIGFLCGKAVIRLVRFLKLR